MLERQDGDKKMSRPVNYGERINSLAWQRTLGDISQDSGQSDESWERKIIAQEVYYVETGWLPTIFYLAAEKEPIAEIPFSYGPYSRYAWPFS